MPGGVDPHIHCRVPTGIVVEGADSRTEPASVVGRAALHGGTTTLIDFAWTDNHQPINRQIEDFDREWRGASYCDYAFHIVLMGNLPLDYYGQLGEAVQDGHVSVKMFTTDIFPPEKKQHVKLIPFGPLWDVLKVLARNGGVAAVHAEDNDIVMYMYEKLIRENRVSFEHMAEVHNTLSEELSFNRVIRLAERVPGAALYMMHTSAETGVEAIAGARSRGAPIYGETLHQYLLYNAEDYKKEDGQIYHTYPSLKFPRDQEALWAATNHGAIQTIATDELCCPLRVKTARNRIDDIVGGNSGVEPRVSLMYTHTVAKRGYSLEQFVNLVSTNAARIMGLYPRKGVLAVGSDADIVVLDTRVEKTITAAELHETDYTPWEGHVVSAWPSVTIAHGKVVVDNGSFFGDLKAGRLIPRKIADDIRSRPAV
jgi:dihydropyrimidinase